MAKLKEDFEKLKKDVEIIEKLHKEFKCVKQQALSIESCLSKCESNYKDSVDKLDSCKTKCITSGHIPQVAKCFKK